MCPNWLYPHYENILKQIDERLLTLDFRHMIGRDGHSEQTRA